MVSKSAFKLACAFALGLTVSTLHAQSLNAKPGAWEMTVKTNLNGSLIPPDALAKMPPERRAMIEKMMAEGRSSVTKSCVKKEDLDSGRFGRQQREGCTVDVVTKTATKLVANTSCASPKATGTMTFEAKDPEHVVGVIEQSREGGGQIRIDIAGRWLSASCDGIDPLPGVPKK
jgi:hypothetical protein